MNPEQLAIVNSTAPDILVAASPGSGKTATLIERIARLVRDGTPPAGILAITYTNAAAAEITHRLEKAGVRGIGYCGTLHGWCLKLLRRHGAALGLPPDIAVLSEQQRDRVLEDIKAQMRWKGSDIAARKAVTQNPLATGGGGRFPSGDVLLAAAFHRFMLENGLVDFDSILLYGAALLDAKPEGLGRWEHVLIDEAQDASAIDHQIYAALPVDNRLFVGDPDQSIFAFRGGCPALFTARASAPGVQLFLLEQNYRCASDICCAANAIIKHNPGRLDKQTVPVKSPTLGFPAAVATAYPDENAELLGVTARIRALAAPTDTAILCRTNAMAKTFADHLRGAGVPVAGKTAEAVPHDWPAIRAYIALLCQPDNDWLAYGWLRDYGGEAVAKAVKAMADKNLTTINLAGGAPRWRTPILAELPTAFADVAREEWAEGLALVRATAADLPAGSTIADLALALGELDGNRGEATAGVTVTTFHSSKGKEWANVFLPGFREGMIPLRPTTPEAVAEERRLAFVAVTRAKDALWVSWPESVRNQFNGEVSQGVPSRFVAEAGFQERMIEEDANTDADEINHVNREENEQAARSGLHWTHGGHS